MPKNQFWRFEARGEDSAELFLYGVLSDSDWLEDDITPKKFAAELKALGDISQLTVHINSQGGDIFAGMAIYNLLRQHPAKIIVRIDGLAASAASIVAMAGDEIIMPKSAMMMIHNPWTIIDGDAGELRAAADTLDKLRVSLIDCYQDRTGLGADKLSELLDKETWLTAGEALELGFIDKISDGQIFAEIMEDTMYINGVGFDLSEFPRLPAGVLNRAKKTRAKSTKNIRAEEPAATEAVEEIVEEDIDELFEEDVEEARGKIAKDVKEALEKIEEAVEGALEKIEEASNGSGDGEEGGSEEAALEEFANRVAAKIYGSGSPRAIQQKHEDKRSDITQVMIAKLNQIRGVKEGK